MVKYITEFSFRHMLFWYKIMCVLYTNNTYIICSHTVQEHAINEVGLYIILTYSHSITVITKIASGLF